MIRLRSHVDKLFSTVLSGSVGLIKRDDVLMPKLGREAEFLSSARLFYEYGYILLYGPMRLYLIKNSARK